MSNFLKINVIGQAVFWGVALSISFIEWSWIFEWMPWRMVTVTFFVISLAALEYDIKRVYKND